MSRRAWAVAMPSLSSATGWVLGAGAGLGLFPVAPATAASLAAVLIYGFAPLPEDSYGLFILIGAGFLVGVWAVGTLVTKEDPDPKLAVWDEFIGMWVTCLFLPKDPEWLAAAFICFRVLDVLKPWPIRRFERLPGGWGIMADDLAAGIAGAAALNVIYRVGF